MNPSKVFEKFLRVREIKIILKISEMIKNDEIVYAGEISNRLDLDPSFLSKKLDEFESIELIRRKKKVGNVKIIELTDQGEILANWFNDIFSRLEAEKKFDEALKRKNES